MNILSVIMTHKDAAETVKRHLQIWQGIVGPIVFTSPVDSPMNIDFEILIGEAEHHGEKSAQRIISIFENKYEAYNWDYLLLMEYDAFVLDLPENVLPAAGGISVAVYPQNKLRKYTGIYYVHYPILFTREAFINGCKILPEITGCNDRFFSDRFIGKAIQVSKVPVKNLLSTNRAFTKNTILPEHIPALRKRLKKGAVFFHGVKTDEILNEIIR